MDTLDLFFDEKAKKLINSFAYCFNVAITIFSTDFKKKLVESIGAKKCDYCQYINIELGMAYYCDKLDHDMSIRSEKSSGPLMYTCHSGLVDAAIPIRMYGVIIGYAMVGQFRTSNIIPNEILDKCQKIGLETKLLQKAFIERPFFERLAAENMLNLFAMLCEFIVSRDYVRFRHMDIVSFTARWIEEHIEKPITIVQAAKYLGYSESTISHRLKQHLGTSFKQLCIIKKIEHFEKLITEDPSMPIKTVIQKVGYDDPSYFSRLYKKSRSTTPAAFVKSIRKNNNNKSH